MSLIDTKDAILLRVAHRPEFTVVPEHAIKLFDHMIEEHEGEALAKFGDDLWARIAFIKERVLEAVVPRLRGMIAGQFHEYVAALLRNDNVELDPYGFDNVPAYGGEARAQYDAHMACCASLA